MGRRHQVSNDRSSFFKADNRHNELLFGRAAFTPLAAVSTAAAPSTTVKTQLIPLQSACRLFSHRTFPPSWNCHPCTSTPWPSLKCRSTLPPWNSSGPTTHRCDSDEFCFRLPRMLQIPKETVLCL